MKKASVLILTFLIPVLIAVFLKFFSVNHFELRVLYQDDVPAVPGCPELEIPYAINKELSFVNSDSAEIRPFAEKTLKVVSFIKDESLITEMNMIGDAFYDLDDVDVFLFADGLDVRNWKVPLADNIKVVEETEETNQDLKRCVFLFDSVEDNALLVDNTNRIRGFYNLTIGQEVDSLIIETKILLREKMLETK